MQAQRGNQRLRLHVAFLSGPFDPSDAVGSAGGNPGSFQVASSDAELRFRNVGTGGEREQRERALWIAPFLKLDATPQRPGRVKVSDQLVEETHVIGPSERRALRLAHPLFGERDHLPEHVTNNGLLADADVRGDRHPGGQVKVRRRIMQINSIEGNS